MPLIARDGSEVVSSFALSATAWAVLQKQNRAARHLRACCCESPVICKTSSHGTPFFAHAARAGATCEHRGETDTHLEAKVVAARAGAACGWIAEVERCAPDGSWRADVLFTERRSIALEIQTSPITPSELLRRHQRYAQAGIQCFWLMAKPAGHTTTQDVPIFTLARVAESLLVDHPPGCVSSGPLPLDEFVSRLLLGQVRWTPWLGEPVPLQIWTAKERCRTGLHVSRQTEKAVLGLASSWPGMTDVEFSWAALSSGSRANEFMALVDWLPFARDGVAKPLRRPSQIGLSFAQGCEVCGKSSWGAKPLGGSKPWKSVEVKASSAWGCPRAYGEGFRYQWWWGPKLPGKGRALVRNRAAGAELE